MAGKEENHDTILMVGFTCYDLIFTSPHYPEEDSLMRAIDFHKRRGGNASNSCSALSVIGAKCELMAPMTTDENGEYLRNDLKANGIMYNHCPIYSQWVSPFTSIIQSLATGSRTIMHYRPKNFPENTFDDFKKLDLSSYNWIHFEGRGVPDVLKMMDLVDEWNADQRNRRIPYSVELEKRGENTKQLIPKGDVIFIGKEFATYLGYTDPVSTIHGVVPKVKPGAVIIVPWGERGAAARCSNGEIVECNAYPPKALVDTTGAGDTFIGATVFYLSQKKSVAESVDFGNKVAGAKCGTVGFSGIRNALA